jgi:hypothetical protein
MGFSNLISILLLMLDPGARLDSFASGDVLPEPRFLQRLNFSHEYLG